MFTRCTTQLDIEPLRRSLIAQTYGGKVYAFEIANELWAFDSSTGAWSVVTENGVARRPDQAYDGKLYFHSGEGGPDTSFEIFDDTGAFDVRETNG